MVPEFTTEESETGQEEVVESTTEATTEEVVETEKETPAEPPAEPEKEEKPAPKESETRRSDDTENLEGQLQALQNERVKLIKEVQELRGQKRELKKEELFKVDNKIEELKDVAPEDVNLIEKVLRAKGYMTREEAEGMSYKAIQDEELKKFLDEFPEYRPENDQADVNWNTLQKALAIYAKPSDPRRWSELLRKAHRDIAPSYSGRAMEVKKQQVKTAGVGASGVQRSSSRKTFDSEKRLILKQGGFTEEDIARMESRL